MPLWSRVTAGGSATTWYASSSVVSIAGARWIPYAVVSDLWSGVDFVAKVSAAAPASVSSDRPIVIWNVSTITASAFTGEGAP